MSNNLSFRPNRVTRDMLKEPKTLRSFGEGTSSRNTNVEWNYDEFAMKSECRICLEEDFVTNMEAPCACNGTIKFAHRKCIQQWCNEKKHIICEICFQPYKGGYTVPGEEEETVIDINSNEDERNENDNRVLTVDEAENLLPLDRYDECGTPAGMRFAVIRGLLMISVAVMVISYAYDEVEEDDHSYGSIMSMFFIRVVAFLMPVYILSWIVKLVIHRIERREQAVRLAARNNARVATEQL